MSQRTVIQPLKCANPVKVTTLRKVAKRHPPLLGQIFVDRPVASSNVQDTLTERRDAGETPAAQGNLNNKVVRPVARLDSPTNHPRATGSVMQVGGATSRVGDLGPQGQGQNQQPSACNGFRDNSAGHKIER